MSNPEEDKRVQQNMTAFAQIAHQQNQAFRAAVGLPVDGSWSQLTDDQRKVCTDKVKYYLITPTAVVSSLHEGWCHHMFNQGWKIGPTDEAKKTHEFLVPFPELPVPVQVESLLFMQTVHALSRLM